MRLTQAAKGRASNLPRTQWRRSGASYHSVIGIALVLLAAACAPQVTHRSTTGSSSWPVTPRLALNRVPVGSFTKLVVFFHGIFGDAVGTWTHESGASWPNLLVNDSQFDDFGIYLVNYPSPKLDRASGIEELANGILSELEDQRVFERFREIYFVGHSMGGLIAKRILVELNRPNQVEKLRRIRAVFYVSTPAQGAPLAELGSWLSENPQLRDMRPADLNSFLQIVENMWQNLMRDRQYDPAQSLRAYCAYETGPTGPVVVVNRVYAATLCDETPLGITTSHLAIVKPANDEDKVFRWASARMLKGRDSPGPVASPGPQAPRSGTPQDAAGLVAASQRSLVQIRSVGSSGQTGFGTGFLFSDDGLILTAASVLPPGSTGATAQFAGDTQSWPLSVRQRDEHSGLVVVGANLPHGARTPLPLAAAGAIPASRLFTIGFDVARQEPPVTASELALTGVRADGSWRTTAAESMLGRSGSPVVDDRGAVVGIVVGATVAGPGTLHEGIVASVSTAAPVVRGSYAAGMQYVVVQYDGPARIVMVDGQPIGRTGMILLLTAGVHEFRLDGPQDYLPAVQVMQLAKSSVTAPVFVPFHRR